MVKVDSKAVEEFAKALLYDCKAEAYESVRESFDTQIVLLKEQLAEEETASAHQLAYNDRLEEINGELRQQVSQLIGTVTSKSAVEHSPSFVELNFKTADPPKFTGAKGDQDLVDAFVTACEATFLFEPRESDAQGRCGEDAGIDLPPRVTSC